MATMYQDYDSSEIKHITVNWCRVDAKLCSKLDEGN